MALQNLGTITNLQKMTGVLLATQDANGNPVALSGLPNPAADQSQSVSFANMTAVPNATPANSQFTFDIIGTGVSNGAVTITIQTQQSNGDAGFRSNARSRLSWTLLCPAARRNSGHGRRRRDHGFRDNRITRTG